jgi:hypothetical protein
MQEIVGIFAGKGDALKAVDSLYAMGYGDTEIGFLDHHRNPNTREAEQALSAGLENLGPSVAGGVAAAILAAGPDDEIGSLYRQGAEEGSAVVTVSIIEGDEAEVTRLLYAAGSLKVNSFHRDMGWLQ